MKKKAPPPHKPSIDYTPWLFGGAVLIGAIVWWVNWGVPNPRGDKPLEAHLQLNNQCGLVEDAYVIQTYPEGVTASFTNGVATVMTTTNSYIDIKASPKYPAFSLDAPRLKVKPNMVVTVRCEPESAAKRTLGAFNDQFKK
jgi:hypothetical protein